MSDNPCCSGEELHDYVRGRLSDAGARRVERHCADCATCGRSLVREAREELALCEVADHAARLARSQRAREARDARVRRVASIGIASIAVAAAALLAFASEPGASSPADERRATLTGPTLVRALNGAVTTDGAPCSDDGRGCLVDASWRPE